MLLKEHRGERQGSDYAAVKTHCFGPGLFAHGWLILRVLCFPSFYNWDRNICCLNSSPNYQVIAENVCGLLFKNKADRKIINVDPKVEPEPLNIGDFHQTKSKVYFSMNFDSRGIIHSIGSHVGKVKCLFCQEAIF